MCAFEITGIAGLTEWDLFAVEELLLLLLTEDTSLLSKQLEGVCVYKVRVVARELGPLLLALQPLSEYCWCCC